MSHGVGTRGRLPARPGDRAPTVRNPNGYWFPMLVFGLLTMIAPLVYQPSGPSDVDYVWRPSIGGAPRIAGFGFAPLQQFGTCDAALGDPMTVALFWFCVLMFGALASLLWYHRWTRRRGLEPQTGGYLLYASGSLALYVVMFPLIELVAQRLPSTVPDQNTMVLLDALTLGGFVVGLVVGAIAVQPLRSGRRLSAGRWVVVGAGMVLAIASAAAIEFLTYLSPRPSYGGLLILAVGLLALSLIERGRTCAVFAVLFTVAALSANVIGFRHVAIWLGVPGGHWSAMGTAFANLVLPGVILLVGALVGGCAVVRSRRV